MYGSTPSAQFATDGPSRKLHASAAAAVWRGANANANASRSSTAAAATAAAARFLRMAGPDKTTIITEFGGMVPSLFLGLGGVAAATAR